MDTSPKIGQVVSISDGVAVARVSMQHIVVTPATSEGHKSINIQDGDRLVVFPLDRAQCEHLAQLLLAEVC